jgi:2,4-didehydro-3-deoxy-L-rhamnonate hydrolase
MKLVRYGTPGTERPGLIAHDGQLRDLSPVVSDLTPDTLAAGALQEIAAIEPRTLAVVHGTPRLAAPLKTVRKFLGVGLNYSDHAAESNMPVPKEPVLFMKASSCLCGPDDVTMIPHGASKLDWEVELGVVIGSAARHVESSRALEHVAGYLTINDVSERAFQLERGGQWDKGKGYDTFGPIGPWLVSKDEIADPQRLDLWLDVNGIARQRGNTARMVFSVEFLVAYISQFITLEPGDIIATGTPPGVGMGMNPPQYLQPGDIVTLGIDGLGEQRHQVVPFEAPAAQRAG